jgi:hypothetical protein
MPEWHTRTVRFGACLIAAAALAASAATSAQASNPSVRETVRAGIAEIRMYKREALDWRLVSTLGVLRRQRASTPAGQRGRKLAIDGFTAARRAVQAELEFYNEDSGRLAEAAIDASRADRQWNRAAGLLRKAGYELGIPVGRLNGR